MEIGNGQVRVTRYDGEPDFAAEIEETFRRFQQGSGPRTGLPASGGTEMSHVEAAVLTMVSRLYPDEFATLARFRADHAGFPDPVVVRFDREVQFYLAYLAFIAPLRRAGLPLCYPTVTASKDVLVRDSFDIALADERVQSGQPVVCNDVRLEGPERLVVLTGPNQGGKTTYARMVGQLHHLAALGCPVPGRSARLPLVDRIFTHFDRTEDIRDLRGKLEDDLTRIAAILRDSTPRSLVVMNETFTSTSLADALLLGWKVLQQLLGRDLIGVYVTFVDELASPGPAVVSMVAGIDPHDTTTRTYRVTRAPADGKAYAMAVAERYDLTRTCLDRRLADRKRQR